MHVLRFGNKLNEEVCRGFIFANLFNSLYLLVRLWWNVLVANLATYFQDLVAKVKNVVALAPVLGAISRPDCLLRWSQEYCTVSDETGVLTTSLLFESKTRKWNPYRTQRILFFLLFSFLTTVKALVSSILLRNSCLSVADLWCDFVSWKSLINYVCMFCNT